MGIRNVTQPSSPEGRRQQNGIKGKIPSLLLTTFYKFKLPRSPDDLLEFQRSHFKNN